jgi:transposase-like protein
MQSHLFAAHFHSEEVAYEYVEARLWPDGPVCPHCGAPREQVGRLRGKTNRIGLCKCYVCRKPFTVKIGTVFESSHVPMRVWLQAIYLFCSSKKGISTRQLQRTFQCGLKTAWFLGHRVREAMTELGISNPGPLGGANQVVESDETFIGGKAANRKGKISPKAAVLSLVERDGRVRSFPERYRSNSQTDNDRKRRSRQLPDDRRKPGLLVDWPRVRGPRRGQPQRRGIRPRLFLAHQHCRKLLLDPQARDLRVLFPRQRSPSAPLYRRVRFPAQQPDRARS